LKGLELSKKENTSELWLPKKHEKPWNFELSCFIQLQTQRIDDLVNCSALMHLVDLHID